MDKNKKTAIIFWLAAALCFICSIIWFCMGKGGLGGMWLCIGSANLFNGLIRFKRCRESEEHNKQEDEKSEQ